MNFTQWSTELSKQQERMKGTALIDVEESLSVDSRQISVTLGKGRDSLSGICTEDGNQIQVRFLRPLYTHHKSEFDAMLDSLTASVDTVMGATDHLMESLTEDAIPDAVIERMRGEQTSGEPKELVTASVSKKLETLEQVLLTRMAFTSHDEPVLKSFDIEFPSVADRKLSLELAWGRFRIVWGQIEHDTNGNYKVPDPEEGMYFLANYNFIEAKLLKVCEALGRVRIK